MSANPTPSTAALHPPLLELRPAPGDSSVDAATLTALMQQVAAGDREAFAELYELTVAVLFAFARRVLRDPADVEEIICDVYIQAWQRAQQYQPDRGPVMAWLVVMCRARAIDRYRHNQSRSCVASAGGIFAEAPATDAGPCDLLSALQNGSAIHGAIERLSPVRQRLLALAFFYDLTHSEIADATNLAEGTVKSHIRRALATLRKDLRGATE
jgi:RNA polymerase sigma-70 factor (ECF subfamily)